MIWRKTKPLVRSVILAPDLAEAKRARRFLKEAAAEADLAPERVFDLTVASSEAIANAIQHTLTKDQVELTTLLYPDRLEVHVEGPGAFQLPSIIEERSNRGLGLPLMASLADHLALYSSPKGGTLVSLTFHRPGLGDEEPEDHLPPSVRELLAGNSLLRDVIDNLPDGFCVLDEEDRFLYANERMLERIGAKCKQLLGRSIWESLPGRGLENSGLVEEVRLENKSLTVTGPGPRPETWYEWSAFPVSGGVAVVSRDISHRRRTEEALRTSLERHALAQRASRTGFWDWDMSSGKLTWSPEFYELLGLPRVAEPTFDTWLDALHPDDREPSMAMINRSIEEHVSLDNEYRVILPGGEERWISAVGDTFYDSAGRPQRMCGVCIDITERKQAEGALRSSQQDLDRAQEVGLMGCWRLDRQRDVLTWSDENYRIFGVPIGTALTYESFLEMVHPEDRAYVDERWNASLRGEPYEVEHRIVIDGVDKWVREKAYSEFDSSGELVGGFGITQDITERKQAEEALRASEEKYRVLAEENERLYRQQLSIAENLQLALLHIPAEIGRVRLGHLYLSATEAAKVGGDFYDVFEVRDGKIAVLIGDVAGHGIEAARVAALTKDVIHAFAHQTLRPHEALKRTNRLLREKSLPGFVTVFLGVLDPEKGILHYACAGHPETMLRRAGGQIELLGSGAPPLGVLDDVSWKMGTTQLDPGDLVLLYTDGVIEARQDGQLFGQDRLVALLKRKRLSVKRLPQLIVDKVSDFADGMLRDDLAILTFSLSGDETGSRPTEIHEETKPL